MADVQSPIFFDLSDWSVIVINGNDRKSFLHSFCTNDINKLESGNICEAFIPEIKGRILGHVFVLSHEDHLTLLSTPGSNEVVAPHLTKYRLGVDAEVTDVTDQNFLLGVIGPQSWQTLNLESEPSINELRTATLTGTEFAAARLDVTNLPTLFIFGEKSQFDAVQKHLSEAGVTAGKNTLFNRLRIEAGFPIVGQDLSDANIAQEAARTEQTISFEKGCYLGQEPIARLDAMGHTNKELRGLIIDSSNIEVGANVIADDKIIGTISSCSSHESNKSVALAVIRSKYTKPGTEVTIQTATGETIPATVYWPRLNS